MRASADESSVLVASGPERTGRAKGPIRFALVAVITLVATLAASPASATTVTAAQAVPGTSLLNSAACSTATTCVAVGFVFPGFGVAVPITNGTPGAVQVVPGPSSTLNGVACPSTTTCLAVGSQFVPIPGHRPGHQAIVVPITNGVLGPVQGVPALQDLAGVACSSATTCYAVGTSPSGGVNVVLTLTNGIPGTVQTVSGPYGLAAVACSSTTTCYAVGPAEDQGVVVPITDGVLGIAQFVPDAALLYGVACSIATTCYAVGIAADFSQTVLVPITNGVPAAALPVTGASLGAIACPSATTCVTVGANDSGGVVVTIVDGVPGPAVAVSGSSGLYAVGCGSVTTCVAVGSNSDQVGVVVSITVPPPCATKVTGNHVGSLVTGAGLTCLSGVHLRGSVIVPRGASVDIENSTITGSISATGPADVRVCGTTVRGSVGVSAALGFVLIGDPGDDGCATNRIGGSLILVNNHHGLEAIGNRVAGTVVVSGNSGAGPFPEDTAPDVSGNGR